MTLVAMLAGREAQIEKGSLGNMTLIWQKP